MPLMLTNAPDRANDILQAISKQLEGDAHLSAISDEELQGLPLIQSMLHPISVATDIIGANLSRSQKETHFACIPVYGDGTGAQLLNVDDGVGNRFVVVLIDLRYAYECLSHICLSPLGTYTPSIEMSAALEKLASATRIASFGETALRHLPLGLIAEAQDTLYGEDWETPPVALGRLMERSFLSEAQFMRVLQTVIFFQIFHEFGHHVCREQPDNRNALEENLDNFIKVQSTNLQHHLDHDAQNAKLLEELFGDEDVSAVLTNQTSQDEFRRLVEARITARQDKEELLCDNYAVQNTAKLLVEGSSLGSSDWILVRYAIEFVLASAWGVLSSRPIFQCACETWNLAAQDKLQETERADATERLVALIEERRKTVVAQRFRLKYALEQYDTVMASLLHSTLGAQIDIRSSIDVFSPSSSMGRIMHEYSARHTNLVDRSLYTIEGLARCSGRGRALLSSLGSISIDGSTYEDSFAFYVLGKGYRFEGSS